MRCCLPFLFILLFVSTVFGQSGKPVITGQDPLSTTEEQSITIQLTDLQVTDRDDWFYPWGFTLRVYPGNNYSLSGSTVTPSQNFTGTLSVPVTVNDGKHDSDQYNVQITVHNVNDAPVITGQSQIQTIDGKPLTLLLTHFTVSDVDNTYPNGFTLAVYQGANYTVSGNTITPTAGFLGTLDVPVTVNDGQSSSATYTAKVTVSPSNAKPVITGQTALNVGINQSITIELSHLQVSDSDNPYPTGFTLNVMAGSNYTVAERTVTPAQNYKGTLSVPVTVNDGFSSSDPYTLKIEVLDGLLITSQVSLETPEDQAITLELANLTVNDPNNAYPQGFSMNITAGENYTAVNRTILPATDFSGILKVGVSVSNGSATSNTFTLQITVTPVNDPPQVITIENEALKFPIGSEPVFLTQALDIGDVDDTHLILAEIGFRTENYRAEEDELIFTNTANIQGIFDKTTGILSLVGNATLAEYRDAIKTIKYYYGNLDDPRPEPKTLYIRLSDGELVSDFYERKIELTEDFSIDIPTGFTPNNDHANDTWKVTPIKQREWFDNAIVRIYDKRGALLYEATGFNEPWDGRVNGELLPADTYYYTIDLNLTHVKTNYKGIITLLR